MHYSKILIYDYHMKFILLKTDKQKLNYKPFLQNTRLQRNVDRIHELNTVSLEIGVTDKGSSM